MNLRRIPALVRPGLTGAFTPIVLGAVMGLAVVTAAPDTAGIAEPEKSHIAAASRPVAPPRIVVPQRPRSAQTARGIWELFLPARPAASDLTHRIENGLPLHGPEPVVTAVAKIPKLERAVIRIVALPKAPPVPAGPVIAIVIDDMGFDAKNSARAVELPPEVTLAYLPFAPSVAAQVRAARLRGHQIMLHLPMEANDAHQHPGRNVLSVNNDEATLRLQLSKMLRSFSGYIGVNNHQGSRFTRDAARMDIVLRELKRRGLFFVDSRTSGRSVGEAAAIRAAIPYATRDIFLDHDPEPSEIRARMAEAERLALRTGRAIAIGHPRTATMKLLEPWIASLKGKGIRLVKVSELLKRPEPVFATKELAQITISE